MSELRYNFLWDTWVVVAPERERRPKDFVQPPQEAEGDPSRCPFDPGREHLTTHEIFALRDNGSLPNSPGWRVRVVPNRFPALRIENPTDGKGLCIYDTVGGFGAHEVVIDTPDHFKKPHQYSLDEMRDLLYVYRERMRSLYGDIRIKYVQVFKNHGREAGASLFHSHSQIIATPIIPPLVAKVIRQKRSYMLEKRRCYLCDEIFFELLQAKRVVYENGLFVAYCPFYSLVPFEVRITSKRHESSFTNVRDEDLPLLADALVNVLRRLYKTLEDPPYNLFIHTPPPKRDSLPDKELLEGVEEFFHWYIEITPRITHLAGFELASGCVINPVPPEKAAKYLSEISI
ncbi:UDPglucose--hexose-1-phosphate uridylyltransferase [Thermosulfidibacter takaii ABI70S6]|uniref:Galactose-1-phosphate uridylyltransferase n=1 Tax=Thermosulfidibacter takaii (strain DSM 17441 / JCM 13301 / NBRC 103674 / ABI70S6) TaxID=1298851 RepID=A0A0S3QUJ3_THET7|nr:galactose-1-phosphate uridylyltransferase [Thermosulfidibacter takaii]BAT71998.1 UDPglucose--hexose-1-phosphate uridylyltransferase [Thermosulfidibacter takaii ABI70S6]